MTTYDDILTAAQNLPVFDRFRLIDAIWESVPPEEWPVPSAAWIAEAQRRSLEFDAGRMAASPWLEVRDRARRNAGIDG